MVSDFINKVFKKNLSELEMDVFIVCFELVDKKCKEFMIFDNIIFDDWIKYEKKVCKCLKVVGIKLII